MTAAEPTRKVSRSPIPALLCAGVLCGMLVVGLLPFRGPRNGVTWLPDRDGVRLSAHSILWSSASFPAEPLGDSSACSLEIWLQPGLPRDSNAILSFSTDENPLQLTLLQYKSFLLLQPGKPHSRTPASNIGTEGVFHQGTPVFLTITSDPQRAAMYVNGQLARAFPQYRFAKSCSGQLVLGTSPVADATWRGQLRGVAVYSHGLTADETNRHYQAWTTKGRPDISYQERILALYLFDEHSGDIVHNAVPGGPDLYIPARYKLPHQILLRPFWQEYKPRWSYVKDILINILGFVPLGFLFCAYWTSVRPIGRVALITTVLGLAVSLTIELLQSLIPTRDSGTTDLVTNTLGTYLGVRLYGWHVARAALEKIYSGRH